MKILKLASAVILLGIIVGGTYLYIAVFFPINGTEEKKTITIPSASTTQDVYTLLKLNDISPNMEIYQFLCNQMSYTHNVKAGKYLIDKDASLINIIRKLRAGDQEPIEVTIYRESTRNELAGKLATYLLTDSALFSTVFHNDSILHEFQLDSLSFMSHIIPNTYFMYYNTSPVEFIQRMKREHKKFWNKADRYEKAASLSMTPDEVYTLASIIERETQYKPERPRIAGVYLNRIKDGIPLQADPTIIYAMGNPGINRVLKKYLDIKSPYNTYIHAGLPPGPIGTASISSLDAVLNAENHDYYYFCAKAGGSGKHVFAKSLSMHLQNARKFQRWLNQQNIYR